jgi:hypothetical protein
MTWDLSLTLGTDGRGQLVTLRGVEAASHKHLMGVTGAGKSKTLESIFLQVLNQGGGVAVIDPAGDVCDHLLATLLDLGFFQDKRAYQRLLYVDFAHPRRAAPFNVLAQPGEVHQMASATLESWKRAWSGLSGGSAPALEQFVLAGTLVLAQNGEPLTQLQQLVADGTYRARLLSRVTDAQVVAYFEQLAEIGKRAGILSESALRRLFLLTFSPVLRDSLGSRTNVFQFRRLMDAGVSLLINLGGLESEAQRFLGCLLMVGFEEAALSRADLPEEQRRPYHLIVDEFPLFAAQSGLAMERVLSLTRKYQLSLTLANQTWGQVPHELRSALQNTTFMAFRLGPEDAAWAANRLATIDPTRTKQTPQGREVFVSATEQREEWEQALTQLPTGEALLRLRGSTIPLRTLQVPSQRNAREAVARVKERYADLLLIPRSTIQRASSGAGAHDAPPTAHAGPSVHPETPTREEQRGKKRAQRQRFEWLHEASETEDRSET